MNNTIDSASPAPRYNRFALTGVGLLLAAAAFWSLNGALIKLLVQGDSGPPAVVIAFYRSLIAGLVVLPLAVGKLHTLRPGYVPAGSGGDPKVRRFAWPIRPAAVLCTCFFTLMTLCFVAACVKTEAANAIILQYTATFWIFGLSPLLLGERPPRSDFLFLGVAMVGIAVIFVGSAATDLTGLIIALGAGLFYALEMMMIRKLRDSHPAAVAACFLLGSAALLFPFAWWAGAWGYPARVWWLLATLGVVQFGLPYYLFVCALKRVPAFRASLIALLEPVLVPVWTFLAVREVPPVTTIVGGVIILAALVLVIRRSRGVDGEPQAPSERDGVRAREPSETTLGS